MPARPSRAVALLAVLAGCAGAPAAPAPPPIAPADPALLAALRAAIPLDPVPLEGDPYLAWRGREPPAPPPGTVCGVRFEADRVHYRLRTFGSAEAARAAGHAVTHEGACGTCSTLQDLAVYLERPDLTAPVRSCGMRLTRADAQACLEGLGFSGPCAATWDANIENTRYACFITCMLSWAEGQPATGPDGRLNPCLQCDEDRSGPVFKATAGRTRRNSGIRSSIPRPAEEVAPVARDELPAAGASR